MAGLCLTTVVLLWRNDEAASEEPLVQQREGSGASAEKDGSPPFPFDDVWAYYAYLSSHDKLMWPPPRVTTSVNHSFRS